MSIWLEIGGYAATEIARDGVSPVTWETGADGGSIKASWTLSLSARSQHQALRPRSLVRVMLSMNPLWTGELAYAERDGWELTAYGMASVGRKFLALDGGGNSTLDLGAAIPQAIARGWRITNPTGISGVVAGEAGDPISVGELLDRRAAELGQRWGVDGSGRLYMRADPTTPTWLASPGASAIGATNEGGATFLAGRYVNSTTGLPATAYAGAGVPEGSVNLADRGEMTLAQAEAALEGMLTRGHGSAWTNGVTLTSDQLTTMGGNGAFLPGVRGGQLMRSFGLAYATGSLALDTVIGLSRYTQGSRTIYVEPVNTSPSTLRGVTAAA